MEFTYNILYIIITTRIFNIIGCVSRSSPVYIVWTRKRLYFDYRKTNIDIVPDIISTVQRIIRADHRWRDIIVVLDPRSVIIILFASITGFSLK